MAEDKTGITSGDSKTMSILRMVAIGLGIIFGVVLIVGFLLWAFGVLKFSNGGSPMRSSPEGLVEFSSGKPNKAAELASFPEAGRRSKVPSDSAFNLINKPDNIAN